MRARCERGPRARLRSELRMGDNSCSTLGSARGTLREAGGRRAAARRAGAGDWGARAAAGWPAD